MAYTFKHGDRPIEGYTIQRAVGKGGFGEVYYAVSDGGREVAIKYLRDNPHIELRGVSHCMNLKSPHLVSIFDVRKTVDDEYAIIMEYCSGPSLRDLLIAEPNGFEPQKAAFFVREIAKGLAYLHDRGIVHRDLKPGNIFYDDGYVKIGDYGLSKFISISRHSAQTASVGTVHYMAPEIGSGNYSRGVDIYALGVMLYEMLLGQVPFEGSSMAEVLMKHLTTQPEVDQLPKPFAQVIRKALQKDPNDRYQNVNEMIDDLLDVQEVRESLAGFSLKSLEGAVHGGAAARADSPMPSPNPIRGFAADFATPAADAPARPPYAEPIGNPADLPVRLAKRMERISNKVDAKVAKLSGKRAPRKKRIRRSDQTAPAGPALARSDRRKRILLAGTLSLGLAIGLGVLVGINMDNEEAGAAAGLLTVALSGGLMLSRRAGNWFGVAMGPNWAQHLLRLVCCGPLLAVGAAPLLDSTYQDEGVAILLGLLALAVFGRWYRDDETEAPGEIRFGAALWKALSALILTAIAGSMLDAGRTEDFIFLSAGVAGVVSLIAQAAVWCFPPRRDVRFARVGADRGSGSEPPPPPVPDQAQRTGGAIDHMVDSIAREQGAGLAQDEAFRRSAGYPTYGANARWGITRAIWGLISFVLMGGAIMGFLIPLVTNDLHYHDITAWIIGCTGFASFMLFALRKTTPTKRETFWLETLRPFLIALSMFGIGAAIVGISREWGHRSTYNGEQMYSCVPDEGAAGIITGLVMASILLLFLVFFTGRKRRPSPPFVLAGSGHGEVAGPATPAVVTPNDFDSGARSMSAYVPAPPIAAPAAPMAGAASAIALMPHRGVLILVLGIVGINLFPLGIAAWIMGHHDLNEMDCGRMDSMGRGLTVGGKVCGIIGSLLAALGVAIAMSVAVVAITGGF